METEVTLQQPPPPTYICGAASVGGGAGGSADLLHPQPGFGAPQHLSALGNARMWPLA